MVELEFGTTDEKQQEATLKQLLQEQKQLNKNLQQLIGSNKNIANEIGNIPVGGQGKSVVSESIPSGVVAYPPGERAGRKQTQHAFGSLPGDPEKASTFDFNHGVVTLPDGTKRDMSTSLKDIGADYVRSLYIFGSSHLNVFIKGEETGFLTDQFSALKLPNIETTEIEISSYFPTNVKVWANTKPDIIQPSGTVASQNYTSWNTNGQPESPATPINKSGETTLTFTTNGDTFNENPKPGKEIHVMHMDEISLTAYNSGSNPVELRIYERDSMIPAGPYSPYEWFPWTTLSGYGPGDTVINSGSSEEFSINGNSHHTWQIRSIVPSSASGNSSEFAVSMIGRGP